MEASQKVKEYQQYLNRIGGYNLKVDGIWGKKTQAAYTDAVNRGLVRPQGGTSKQTTSKPKLVPAELSDYDLMAENADLNQSLYPVEAIQDWGGYRTVVSPNGTRYTVDDIKAGKYTGGTVPAYISKGKLVAGQPESGYPSETITNNQVSFNVYKKAIGDWLSREFSQARLADVVTGGVFHRLSPTQNARLLYDVATGGDWRNSMIYGNSGIISDQLAEEHPILAMAINATGDAAAFNAGNISKMFNPTRLIANGRASYTGPTQIVLPAPSEGREAVYWLPRGGTREFTWEEVFNGSGGAASRKFGTGRGQTNLGNKGSISVGTRTKHGNKGWKDGTYTKVFTETVKNPESTLPVDNYTWNPAILQWRTTGATMPTYTPEYVNITGTPYHNEVVRNFHDDEWIKKFQATPEGGVFWHNDKSYIKQTGGRDRFVRESYNDGQTPWGNSATQVYFDRGVPVVEVPWGTPTGITRTTGEDTGNINYNKAVNKNTGKSEKSKAKGK